MKEISDMTHPRAALDALTSAACVTRYDAALILDELARAGWELRQRPAVKIIQGLREALEYARKEHEHE